VVDAPRPITGHCLCGGVTYSVDADPVWQGVCYCSNCQRQTATAFSVIVGVPIKALLVEGDTLASFSTPSEGYQSTTERRFCSGCGSPIFSTIESTPDLAFLKGRDTRRSILARTNGRDLDALGAAVGTTF
jgi:hypothetical protein